MLTSPAMTPEREPGNIGPVPPSRLGTQPIGEVAGVADGVYQLKLPVPIPLRFVSVYLIEGDDGWTVVDTGFDYPTTYEVWEKAAALLGLDLDGDLARIVVTHHHPDHLGAARWLQERSGAPVCMLEAEISFSRALWDGYASQEPFVEHLARHGTERGLAESAAAALRSGLPLPEAMIPIRAGEKLPLGVSTARVVHAPGHADNQLVLHDEARGILFAADHVLLKITPNVGLWPGAEPQPLARYLDSLDRLRDLDVELVLPGHGPLFHDLDGRVGELERHHEERLAEMLAVLRHGPKTAHEVSLAVFRDTLTIYERCFALAETLAHLEHLVLTGLAERAEDGRVRFVAR